LAEVGGKVTRREVTSRKPGADEPTPTLRLALSIAEFCWAHGFSEGMFYKMKKQGLTPREMKVGTRRLTTLEAVAEWRAAREAASTAPPEKARVKREQAP
jgi:predicted DNA-binding transcriptional regulator AlpA